MRSRLNTMEHRALTISATLWALLQWDHGSTSRSALSSRSTSQAGTSFNGAVAKHHGVRDLSDDGHGFRGGASMGPWFNTMEHYVSTVRSPTGRSASIRPRINATEHGLRPRECAGPHSSFNETVAQRYGAPGGGR